MNQVLTFIVLLVFGLLSGFVFIAAYDADIKTSCKEIGEFKIMIYSETFNCSEQIKEIK